MKKNEDIKLEIDPVIVEEPAVEKATETSKATVSQEEVSLKEEAAEIKEQAKKTFQKINEKVKEEDSKPTSSLTLRTILGGDFLTAELVRRQIWLIVLIVIFTFAYIAFRYQCQQDMIVIDKLEKELLDAKYKALSSSSTLTEKCRESHILNALRNNKDSLLQMSKQPPYIINVPE